MASRMQVASYVAGKLTTDRAQAVRAAAAWLSAHGHSRQAPYLARDVAQVLSESGYLLARVTTARPLSDEGRKYVEQFLKDQVGARELELEITLDPSLIGGITIETPGLALDASVRTKLARYVEGVRN